VVQGKRPAARLRGGPAGDPRAVSPGHVPELVALDADRGWLLIRDCGERLRELVSSSSDLFHWRKLLPEYAELQLALAPHAGGLLAAGVPDERLRRPAGAAGRPARRSRGLHGRPENGLTTEEHERLETLLPEYADTCARLTAFGIPETLQHDDLHDARVRARWSMPLLRLERQLPLASVPHARGHDAHPLELAPGGPDGLHLRNALEAFGQYGSQAELVEAADLALDATAARVDRADLVRVCPPDVRGPVDPGRLLRDRHPPSGAPNLVGGRDRDRAPANANHPGSPGVADTDAGGGGRQSPAKRARAENTVPRTSSWNASSASGDESIRVFAPLSMLHQTAARTRG
jgi:hypothetical protein